ncbi:MAG: YaaR family protein [Candidatus Hydrogenedentota bacterium]
MKVTKAESSAPGTGSLKSGGGKDLEKARVLKSADADTRVSDIEETSSFEEIVKNYSTTVSKYELEKLIREIDEIGKVLPKTGSLSVFARYKALIQEFLRKVIPDLYRVVEKKHRRFVENEKIYLIAEDINEKLEELADELVKKEKNNLNILSKVDDIRGLLLDIVILEGKEE